PRSTLFPYTTLFRSAQLVEQIARSGDARVGAERHRRPTIVEVEHVADARGATEQERVGRGAPHQPGAGSGNAPPAVAVDRDAVRSEEHTSELQSRSD